MNQFPDEDAAVQPLPISWEVDVSPDEKAYFDELVQYLGTQISPGDSLKEIRVIADDALVSEIQSLTGKPYQPGQHYPEGVAVPIEHSNTFSSTILIRRVFFALEQLEQVSTLVEELYHCRLYHLAWHRRGSVNLPSTNLFAMCTQMHDEYSVARLKNVFFGEHYSFPDAQGQLVPFFIEYGASLSLSFDQADYQLRTGAFHEFAPAERKVRLIPFAYRSIFEPLARHAGFLTPISPEFPLRGPENIPEANDFYREVIALMSVAARRSTICFTPMRSSSAAMSARIHGGSRGAGQLRFVHKIDVATRPMLLISKHKKMNMLCKIRGEK